VWIQTGNRPLPRKLVLTYKRLPGSPRFTALISKWDLTGIPAYMLEMKLPSNAEKIEILPVAPGDDKLKKAS
jgi:hypothetical protein